MKRRVTFLLVLVNFVFACGTQDEKKAEEQKKDTTVKTEAVVTRPPQSFLNDYNALEQLFTNDNWLLINKKDSSYFYFSRLGNFQVNTYEYNLEKGDSAKVKHRLMQTEGDQVTWTFNNQKLILFSASDVRTVWTVAGADSTNYEFMRLDKNNLRITYPDRKQIVAKKMLPFSLFLVRSRYDFSNGTRYTFDTTQFNKKGRK
ncbi:MAG: hypothetical protein V4539_10670 [Bacteroidota bacterium]